MLGILFAPVLIHGAFGAPAVEAPRSPVDTTAAAAFRFTEDVSGPVLVDGCAPMELERKQGDLWVAVPPRACDRSVVATEIDKEITLSSVVSTAGTWRVAVTWGEGCVSGRPLMLAACKRLDVARSAAFEVAGPPR